MAKHVVTYTIANDDKRADFVNNLEKVGLKKFPDQSVHYGSYNKLYGIEEYLRKISAELGIKDVVYLFKGESIPNNQKTIEMVPIKERPLVEE